MTMGSSLYLGVDVGTTGAKAIVVDAAGDAHGRGHAAYALECPRPGEVVQDATAWQEGVTTAVRAACAGLDAQRIAALAISAQGGTLVAVDERLRPLAPARSWLDRRATGAAAAFERRFGREDFYRRTGWPIAPNNTAAQLLDLAAGDAATFAAASCFCDTAAYLNGWLAGTPTIDANVAGIGQLTDVQTGTWDAEILELIGVAPERLPRIAAPGVAIGALAAPAADALGLRPGIVVGAGAQDQYCAALGAGAVGEGDVLLSTGTAWVMLAAAAAPYPDAAGGIGCGRHLVPGRWGHFGEIANGGVSIEWGRRLLNHGDHAPVALGDLEVVLAQTPPGADGLSFFPYFDGTDPADELGDSRGSLVGLSLSHDHRHVLRAIAEGVAFAMRMLLERYRASVGGAGAVPIVVGGATRSRAWMQVLAGILGGELRVDREPDAACVGAAILAATAAGELPSAQAGVERMAGACETIAADPPEHAAYDARFAAYRRDADALRELYAARAGEGS